MYDIMTGGGAGVKVSYLGIFGRMMVRRAMCVVVVLVAAGCGGGGDGGGGGEAVAECSSWVGQVVDADGWADGCTVAGEPVTVAEWDCAGRVLRAAGEPADGGVWAIDGEPVSGDADAWSDAFWSCQG